MKIHLFLSVFLVSLLFVSCTQSNEEKAMALIETDMNQTLLYPSSFEVAKMELDSCFKDDQARNAETFKFGYEIATLYKKYKEAQQNVKHAESSMSIYADSYRMGYDFGVQQYKQHEEERDQAMAKAESYKEEIIQLIKNNIEIINDIISKKHEFDGFMTVLSYRAKNNAGNVVMDEVLYFFDKDLTKIIARYGQKDLIGLQGFDYNDVKLDFEEELSSLMDNIKQ